MTNELEQHFSSDAKDLWNSLCEKKIGVSQLRIQSKEVLLALWQATKAIDPYELHKQYRVSPRLINELVGWLTVHKLASTNDDHSQISLTELGRHWVFLNRKILFMTPLKQKPWQCVDSTHRPTPNPKRLRYTSEVAHLLKELPIESNAA